MRRSIGQLPIESISEERRYQVQKWGDEKCNVAEFVLFMKGYHARAVARGSQEKGWDGALDEIRKVAALGVACLEQHGYETLIETADQPMQRDAIYAYISKVLAGSNAGFLPPTTGSDVPSRLLAAGFAIDKAAEALSTEHGIVGTPREWVLVCVCRCVACMSENGIVRRVVNQEPQVVSPSDFKVVAGKVNQLWTEVFLESDRAGGKLPRQTIKGAVDALCRQNNDTITTWTGTTGKHAHRMVEQPKAPWEV